MRELVWFLFRKDIGRKLTALGLAVVVWLMLAFQLRDKADFVLDVHFVEDRLTAEQEAEEGRGLWIVVPRELILRGASADTVVVTASGLETDVRGLQLSAVFEVSPDVLHTQDSGEHQLYLNNTDRYRTGSVNVRDLELAMQPKRMTLHLASRDEEVFDLGSSNVQIKGVPKEGNEVDRSRISVSPSQVVLTGPRETIELLRRDPSQIRLEPVDVEGRTFKVSRQVGLDGNKVDRLVTMRSAEGVVQVDVPVVPLPTYRDLFSIRVRYENEDALARRGKKVVSKTETVDLRLRGPGPVLDARDAESLRKSIRVVYDWADASNDVATQHPYVLTTLPDSIQVFDLDSRQLEIEYTLEDIAPAAASADGGDPP